MSSSETTDVAEVQTPAVDELRGGVVARLGELLGDGLIESHVVPGIDAWVRVSPESWQHAGESLRFTMGARYLSFISVIDWLPSPWGRSMDAHVDTVLADQPDAEPAVMTTGVAGGETRFQVFARVTNLKDHWGLTLKVDVGDNDPTVASWTSIYAGADWHEREAWEMFGVDFVGHPFLRNIYLPTGFEGNPGRKDFPLLARFVKPWPGIVDVEQMPGSDDQADESAAAAEEAS